MGPPTTPIKENGIRGRRLGSEDLEVSSSNKFKENERMQKASSSSNILDSSNGTGLFSLHGKVFTQLYKRSFVDI